MKADETIVCWGDNGTGMLGDGTTQPTTSVRTVTDLTSVKRVSAPCAITNEASVVCWGLQSASLAPSPVSL